MTAESRKDINIQIDNLVVHGATGALNDARALELAIERELHRVLGQATQDRTKAIGAGAIAEIARQIAAQSRRKGAEAC